MPFKIYKRVRKFIFDLWVIAWPIIVILLALCVWRLQKWQEISHRRTQMMELCQNDASARLNRFKAGSIYEAQISDMFALVKRDISRGLELGKFSEGNLGEMLSKAIQKRVSPSHLSKDPKIYAFLFDSQNQPKPLSGTLLENRKTSLILSLLAKATIADTLPVQEMKSLDHRCTGVFGELGTFDFFSFKGKGKAIPVDFENGKKFLIWQPIVKKEIVIGAFLGIFNRDAYYSSKPLVYAMKKYAASKKAGIRCVLTSHEKDRSPGKAVVWAPKSVIPESLGKNFIMRLHQLERENKGNREKFSIPGQVSLILPGYWVIRNALRSETPYELWLFYPIPKGTGFVWLDPNELLLLFIVLSVWFIYFFLPELSGKVTGTPLGIWFGGYFVMVGVLPLALIFSFSNFFFSINQDRSVKNILQKTLSQFEMIDSESVEIDAKFRNLCQKSIFNPALVQELDKLPIGSKKKGPLLSKAFDFFSAAGLELCDLLLYRYTKDMIAFTPSDKAQSETLAALDMNFLLIIGVGTGFEPLLTDEILKPYGQSHEVYFKIFKNIVASSLFLDYFEFRTRTQFFRSESKLYLQYMDFISSQGHLKMCVLFRAIATRPYQEYLQKRFEEFETSERENSGPGLVPIRYAFCRNHQGLLENLFPKSSAWMGSREFKKLAALMKEAADSDGSRILYSPLNPNVAFVSYPARRIPEMVFGAEIILSPLFLEKLNIETLRNTLTLAVLVLIVFLGLTIISHLLSPLGKIQKALARISTGDLSTRLELSRNDEIGEVARAFDSMTGGLERRRNLARFVSDTLESELEIASQKSGNRTGYRETNGVVLVSDMRDFTTISEKYPPDLVVNMLNGHLEAMTQAIKKFGGKIDQFIGDAVVAVFVEPSLEIAAKKALQAAAEMMKKHAQLQEERKSLGEFNYAMGIGIDAGKILIASFGSELRMERNIIGDPRSLAERLEVASKKGRYSKIVVSKTMKNSLPEISFENIPGTEGWELMAIT
ncbi:MAG: HAMP domain-containing protein [Candidatus Riflebacteria bacterium]|nr:HAMP domain-containing protein [Candidatus Riflebacteria bacterium]